MNISAVFIKRPIATALLAVAVLLAGAVAFRLLPVSPLPRVDFPTISVSASLPGASPETMASAVATPLERRFGRIAGVTEITSTSSLGNTSITLQFDLDRDVDSAARDVQAAIAAAGGELPAGLPFRPSYRKVNPADSPVMILSLTSDVVPLAQVFEAANAILAQKISQLEGVGQVSVGGGQQPAVRVQVDPDALAGVGLGMVDVRTALAASTIDQPKGAIGGDVRGATISANDQLLGAEAYKDLVISYKDGAPVRLADVAAVFDDVENNQIAAWTNGTRSVLMIIRRQPGANIIDTNDRIKRVLPTLLKSIPAGVNVEVALDRTQTIRASVEDVEFTLVISVVLVVLVVFVFLRSIRATIIPSIAVPLSLVATFGVMYLLDYSLDNLSLMALTISTGFVVDDAIVVTENIARFIELGRSPQEAALEGAKQIGFTIVSITVSLLAVFIPILLMGGIVGRLFREFAVTLSIAIAVSAVVSLTLTPMMCAQLLKHDAGSHGKVYRKTEEAFDWMSNGYDRALGWVLDHALLMQIVTLATVILTGALFVIIPKGLFPQQDTGLLMGQSDAPQDVSFASMRERQQRINAAVRKDPDIAHVLAFIGRGGGSSGNTGTVFVDLKPIPPRKSTADEIINRLRPQIGRVEGVKLFLQAIQDVRVGGRGARSQYQYTLQDADLDELRIWAPKLMAALAKLPQLKDVNTDQQTQGLQLNVKLDRDTAARLGLQVSTIDDALYDAFGQRQVATMYSALNQYRVVLEVKPAFSQTPDVLDRVYVKSATGALVPLPTVATVSESSTALSITHQGQFPCITLSFNLSPGVALGQAVEAVHRAELEIGLPPSIHGGFQGTAEAFQASLKSQPYLIAAALVAVYIVLGMLYESLIHPLTILSTLPSAGVGALLALLLFKTDFSIIALIGIILLIGIVKKNAIMMIDFALEVERDEGLSARESIHRACVLRFRPIMMTTLAALFGGLPLAFGHGMGAEMRRPLGIAIVGGLLVSQMLTLFTTPVIYLLLDRFRSQGKTRRSVNTYSTETARPASSTGV